MQAYFKKLKFDIFGESHCAEIGMVLEGVPKGVSVSSESVQTFVDRRKSGNNVWSTPRKEADIVEFTNGIENGKATGEPIRAIIKNTSVKTGDYDKIIFKPRPSHADYVAGVKDKCSSGGGRFSGRMTAPLCIAGAIAIDILEQKGIEIGAYISEIGGIKGGSYKTREVSIEEIRIVQKQPLALLNRHQKLEIIGEENQKFIDDNAKSEKNVKAEGNAKTEDNTNSKTELNTKFEDSEKHEENGSVASEIENAILNAREAGDSLGGAVECMVFGLPVGLGDAMFDGLESRISSALFAIPAVKGVEFGSGFEFAAMCGSEANDEFKFQNGKVVTTTNHNGGINGGISNGMPLTLRVAIKPTPSISIEQATVDLKTGKNTTIKIEGRHDACIVPRAVPCVESAAALAILDALLEISKD